jgi:hypothetical protein
MRNDEQLLLEVEDLLRTMPAKGKFDGGDLNDDVLAWLGRAAAFVNRWSIPASVQSRSAIDDLQGGSILSVGKGYPRLRTLLFEARSDLRMQLGRQSVVVQSGHVFEYFDELRKIVETGRSEAFFVDPYLDADFVPRYLPHVKSGVAIRLMGGPKRMPTLLPAVELFAKQAQVAIQVRSSTSIHDRYLFVDRAACYQSGGSFKDGAKNAPVTLTQVTDAFQSVWDTYDALWNSARVERN